MPDQPNTEQPLPQALIVCDSVIVEAGSNKKSVIGIFNLIGSLSFPMHHPAMSIFAAMTNGRGDIEVTIRCVRVEDGAEIFAHTGTLNFPDPNQVVEMVLNLRNTPFERPGLYTFELLCSGNLLLEKRFNVVQFQQQIG